MFIALFVLVLRFLKYISSDLIKDLACSVLISICNRIWFEKSLESFSDH